jgi:hypothetical protein
MAQVGLGGAAVFLFLSVGTSYIRYIGKQLTEARQQHREELERLMALWQSRLEDSIRRGDAWETAAHRYEQANRETTETVRRLTALVEPVVALIHSMSDTRHT